MLVLVLTAELFQSVLPQVTIVTLLFTLQNDLKLPEYSDLISMSINNKYTSAEYSLQYSDACLIMSS